MPKVLFSPRGLPITAITVHMIGGCPVQFDDDGKAEQDAFSDFPSFEDYTSTDNVQFVTDRDGAEFLVRHCRTVEVDEHFDAHGDEHTTIDAWDEHIVHACSRIAGLCDGVRQLDNLPRLLPHEWLDDTCKAVIDGVLLGRMNAEIAALNREIDAYRAARTEIENIDELCVVQAGCPRCGNTDNDGSDICPDCGEAMA